MKFLLILFLSISTLWSSIGFKETYKIYQSHDFVTSLKHFEILASNGDGDAAYLMGYMYENGEGCKVDKHKAQKWYKISSKIYYDKNKYVTSRYVDKEKSKLYKSLEKLGDTSTANTIKRYAQSLYNIKVHDTIYFLPISYRYNGNYKVVDEQHEAKKMETEFQISIRFDFAVDLLSLGEIYTVAYTQLAFWQLYEESAYFRETNYNPEFFVTFPISELYNTKYLKVLKVAFGHESNGRGAEQERSWNYLNSSLVFQYNNIFTELKMWYRLADTTDYNPELIDYMGHGHIRFIVPYKKHMGQMTLRDNFKGNSAAEINYSYPAFGREDLFFYVKAFNGYGESLIDYNHHVKKIGLGFSISR